MQYIKISNGYIAVDDDCKIKRFSISITEDMEKYNMIHLFEDNAKKTKESMNNEGYDLVSVFDHTPDFKTLDYRDETVLERTLSFAKRRSWKFVTNREDE